VKLDWDSDLGPEDMFDAALRSGHREEEDGAEFIKTMVIVSSPLYNNKTQVTG
jgi:hypothetical protein